LPGRSFRVVNGDAQATNRPLSSLHWKLALGSLELKRNFGRALRVFFGPLLMVVSGGVGVGGGGGWGTRTENERVATEELPAASLARTLKVYEPSASGLAGVSLLPGPEQARKLAVPASREHWKVTGPTSSLPLNVKVGVWSAIVPVGPEFTLTWGGIESST
jgi:hypothetical protein